MLLDVAFADPLLYGTIVFVLVASIVLHELGHALVASWEGDPTPKIRGHLTWNPVVHMGWISLALIAVVGIGWGRTPVTPSMFRHRRWGSVLVAGAGPAVNLFLVALGAMLLVMVLGPDAVLNASLKQVRQLALASPVGAFWLMTLQFNLLLFLFNLIPIPPLDGFSVAEGTFDLGELGDMLKRAGFLAFVIAILIVNSDAFGHVWDVCANGVLYAAARVVSP
jgi:Zn-dependent protease